MSLRRQNLSPTANLLRNSRLFALPNPLPRPLVAESFGAGNLKGSDTATLPYPTHQAITSTPSSRARGDWGLKRPLPARSRILKRSNPIVRVTQWDTIEQVTDYDSATDHVRTREKFEEMGVPVLKGMGHFSETGAAVKPKSAFEANADVTAYTENGVDGAGLALQMLKQTVQATQANVRAQHIAKRTGETPASTTYVPCVVPPEVAHIPNRRWKHDGPWLPGMGAKEFTSYVAKELNKRKREFNWYLMNYVKGQIYASRLVVARRTAGPAPLDAAEAEAERAANEREWTHFTRADIAHGIQRLRERCAADPLTSDLVQKLIIPFLRLPPIKVSAAKYDASERRFAEETTPNSTHPSAGLGYLRTKSYVTSHPVLGPQALPSPVTARVVQPRMTKTHKEQRARLGVAGFIAEDEYRDNSRRRWDDAAGRLDVDTEGGEKIHVQPLFAAVSPEGKVHIKVQRSYGPELQVARGELEDRPPARVGAAESLNLGPSGAPNLGLGGEGSAQSQDLDKQIKAFEEMVKANEGGKFV